MPRIEQYIAQTLARESEQGRRREAPLIQFQQGLRYRSNGSPMLSFCSNDFLGYASEPIQLPPGRSGSGASRLVHGNHEKIRELEKNFAQALGYDDAILCSSGYQANIAGLAQLPLPENTSIYSDQLNHASIIDGLRLHKSRPNLLDHLQAPPVGGHWWVLESRFSMDGDAPELVQLEEHQEGGGLLYLDEAHRFGTDTQSISLAAKLAIKPELANYPLGKAFGLQGSILAGSHSAMQWIRQFARAYIYTTASSPFLVQLVAQRMQDFFGNDGEQRREKLRQRLLLASQLLGRELDGPILSLPLGDNLSALQASEILAAQGLHVQAIRPPTVPAGTARLRICFSANHDEADIRDLFKLLRKHEWI